MEPFPGMQSVYEKWESRNRGTTIARLQSSRGKQAWQNKFGDSLSRPVHRRIRDKRNTQSNGIIGLPGTGSLLGQFKVTPTILPDVSCRRPFLGRCCAKCLPISRQMYFDNDITEIAGLQDVLKVELDQSFRSRGIIMRPFCHITHVITCDNSHKYHDVTKAVLNSFRVNEAIEKTRDEDKPKRQLEKRAQSLVLTLKAKISKTLVRLTAWVLLKILGRILSSIQVQEGQMAMVKQASQSDSPLLFLPIHRSHLDYILIAFILFNHNIKIPYVAAGDNLNIPFFSSLMKGLGGFFIRRRLDQTPGKKDLIYRAVLHSYMAALLERGAYMEFFIEGGRSRTGKALKPKGGLLSVVVDTYVDGHCPDLQIVPISISYEKILDGNFKREQMGELKIPETFFGAIKAIWRVLTSSYGSVRVDFAQPFSLQEYMESASTSGSTPIRRNSIPNKPTKDHLKRVGSGSSLYGTDIVLEDQRQMVNQLANHIIHTCVQTQPMMSTSLLAFLLLNKHRQGVSMVELVASFDWLKQEVLNHNHDIGFVGETQDVIEYAATLLRDELVSVEIKQKASNTPEYNNNVDNIFLTPTTTLPNVFELAYYSNTVITVFQLESVIACSICAVADLDLFTCQGQSSEECTISRNEVLEKASLLCDYLQYDFTFVSPCQDLQLELSDALEKLVNGSIIEVVENEMTGDRRDQEYAQRLAKSFAQNDSDEEDGGEIDQQYTINLTDGECIEKFKFLQNVLSPFIETYWLVAFSLTKLLHSDKPETEFIKEVHQYAFDRVEKGMAYFAESVSMDCIKNAMKVYQHLKITEVYFNGNRNDTKMIGLQDRYNDRETLQMFIHSIECFRM